MEDMKLKAEKQTVDDTVKPESISRDSSKTDITEKNLTNRTSAASSTEQDLDTFLLGDLEDSDDGPGILLIPRFSIMINMK